MFVWDVDPEIFRVGPFAPRWYGLLFALGFLAGYWIMERIYRHEGRSEESLSRLFLYVFLGTLIGARLGHVLFYQPDYYFGRPWEIPMIWHGGLASHGGFTGVLIAIYLYLKKTREMSFLELADRLTIPSMLAAMLIRIGNFFNSEILGLPSSVPWAVVFARVDNVPRHPAMLYEALAYAAIFAWLYFAYWKTGIAKFPGRMLGVTFVLAFGARFFLEFFKEAQVPFERGLPLNMGQLLSLPFIAIGVVLWARRAAAVSGGRRTPRRRG
jgi:phosphatidylglycerol:prolipoprotein diacylglycerol transferase